ncbi:hypothetical protein, partial [Burkholderia sp. Cy-637]|uniref:hypothetical protein n=1 Tax=Burkholderia sp. Cy-637 TaxID=2608327 RepID=UPI001964259D
HRPRLPPRPGPHAARGGREVRHIQRAVQDQVVRRNPPRPRAPEQDRADVPRTVPPPAPVRPVVARRGGRPAGRRQAERLCPGARLTRGWASTGCRRHRREHLEQIRATVADTLRSPALMRSLVRGVEAALAGRASAERYRLGAR